MVILHAVYIAEHVVASMASALAALRLDNEVCLLTSAHTGLALCICMQK